MRHYVRATILTALVLAMGVMSTFRQHSHGRQSARGTVNYHHFPAGSRRDSSRNGRAGSAARSSSDYADVSVATGSKPGLEPVLLMALPATATISFVPQLSFIPTTQIHVVMPGSMARAPGSPRGPPTLS